MSSADPFMEAQSLVIQADAGSKTWAELIRTVDLQLSLGGIEDDEEFVDQLYFNFRLIEACAHARQKDYGSLRHEIIEGIVWARRQRAAIEGRLVKISAVAPTTSLERVGKRSLLKEFRWALRLLDESFPTWGY